ncbi:Hypothetical predicted protein [Mytilus galloprovincialis]|uniref:G-protein coupled receptors family 1 profile domain-containing protein n=1 Tax=Mytilus galloprovincialis TaxID=29158 RepID=A0A8B6BUV4_MYTGA|nr:Hypothetical predicted protein [Mytilus galloprovincialis]
MKSVLNHTVQTTICKFSAVDTSAKITAYFGFLGLIIVANIVLTAALYVPVLRRIHMSLSKKTTKSVFYKINDGHTSSNIESASQPTKTSSIDSGTQPSVSNPTNQIVAEATGYDSKPNEMCRNKEFTNVCSYKEPFGEDLVKNNHINNAVKPKVIMDIDNEIKHDGGLKRRNDSVKRRITIMFFVIILAYIISYIPALIILILIYAIDDFNFITLTEGETISWIYLARFVFLNHIVNPFIYSYFDVKFRTELKTFFLCKRNQRSS